MSPPPKQLSSWAASFSAVLVLLASACASVPRADTAAGAGDREVVMLANARFDAASVARDPVALDRLMADDFVHVNYTGARVTKPSILRSLSSNRGFGYPVHRSDSVEVKIYGTTAVMDGIMVRRGEKDRPEDDGTFRFTRVWVNTPAGWRVTANQYTAIDGAQSR